MKLAFKIGLIVSFFLTSDFYESSAQTGPIVCNVTYSYDVGGQRIKREYVCAPTWSPGDPETWTSPGTLLTNLFPNPTTGVITGTFSEPLTTASFLIYAVDGSIVLQHNLLQQATIITFDITAQVPGTYFLTMSALDKVETYTIIKM